MVAIEQGYLRLLTLLSPVFPVGSFSYSHGLEQAVYEKLVKNREDMANWLEGLLLYGSVHNDAIFLAHSWTLVQNNESVSRVATLARALCSSKEREMETLNQGKAFIDAAIVLGWKNISGVDQLVYPVAVGMVASSMQIDLTLTLTAYLHAFVSNLVQAAIRLVPLGQKDGVKLMQQMEETLQKISKNSDALTLDHIGSATFMADIMAMRHEKLYSRIFRS